ncbi:MAG: hypothetical protein ACRENL_08825, partial [Candidatus Dormibacteria bacterium]
ALFLLLGVGWEQMVSAFQMGFSLSLVCGLGWLLVTGGDLPGPTRLLSGWALGVAGSMSTGIGIPMIGGVAVAALARRGSRDAVAVVSVPVLANLAWFASVHPRATLPSTTQQLWMLPQFVWHGLSATADGALGLPVVGSVLLVALVAWLVARARTVSPMALGSAAGAVFLFILVGYGRISLGVDQAAASRYLYLAAALLGCPAALALTEMSRRRPVLEALLVAGLAVSTLHGAYVLRLSIRGQLAIRLQDRAIVMAAARVVSSGATVLGTHPDPVYGPDIDVPDLRTLVRTGALPVTGAVDAASLITVESRLEMSAGSSPAVTGPPPIATILDGTRSGTGSCDVQPVTSGETARVRLAFSGPASFSMTGGPAELVTAVLSSSQTGAIAAATVTYQLHQGTPLWISVTAPGAVLSVAVPGPTSLGGVGAC